MRGQVFKTSGDATGLMGFLKSMVYRPRQESTVAATRAPQP